MMTKIDIRDADWAKTIVMFYLLMFVLLLCSGCATRSQSEDLRVPGEQFQVIAYELSTIAADRASAPTFMVIRHKISGRCFLFAEGPEGAGAIIEVTPSFRMYAIDGKPTSNEEDLCAEGVEK